MIFHNLSGQTKADYESWKQRVGLEGAAARCMKVQIDHDSVYSVYGDLARKFKADSGRQESDYELACGFHDDDVKLLATAFVIMSTGKGIPGTRIYDSATCGAYMSGEPCTSCGEPITGPGATGCMNGHGR